ncbi:MAG TPA: CAP domain-containing protein, partial [Phycisphaerae bacterium]|nr:CAP domain-containing protein [Phycisphaerae bacterium]
DRAKRFGTTARGENIAGGPTSGEAVIMKSWWYSPGHLKNMMGDYGRVGLGCYEKTWTLLFG